MATLNEIAYNIAENLNDQSEILINRLKFSIVYYRAMLIRRDYTRNNHLPESLLQELVLDMEKIKYHDPVRHEFIRSKSKPPVPIRISGPVFHYVGGVDRKTPYQFIYPEQMEYQNHNKWVCKPPGYSYIDGYVTVHNISAGKVVIRGVFEDPSKVDEFKSENGENIPCPTGDEEFPIPYDMIDIITKGILSGEMSIRRPGADQGKEVEL